MNSKKNKLLQSVSTFIFLIMLAGCNQKQATEDEILRPVRSIVVTNPETGWVKEFPGVIDAVQKADLSFRVSGKLQKILIKEGDHVVEGQQIAQLDQADYKVMLKDRQATYDVAKADYDRARKLVNTGAIARAELDNLKAKVSTASAQLEAAQLELDYTMLRAPFSGRVARRYVDNFEEVSAKQEIFSLQDTSSLLVEIELPESVLVRSKKQQSEYQFLARFSFIPEKTFPLTIREKSTQADEDTQTYTITFNMPAIEGYTVLPGMSVQVSVKQKSPKNDIVLVPAYAVMEDKDGRFVYVVSSEEEGVGVINRRPVTTGRLSEDGMVITSGLNLGDRVVTAGMSQMSEGLRVQLQQGDAR